VADEMRSPDQADDLDVGRARRIGGKGGRRHALNNPGWRAASSIAVREPAMH
jgi:hypothetical protein